ncbi:MAG: hypothetical protein ACI4HI_01050 [Lachnospiraceae bacterium]
MMKKIRKKRVCLTAGLFCCALLLGCGKGKEKEVEHPVSNLTEEAVKQQDNDTPGWQNKEASVLDTPSFQLQGNTFTLPCSYDDLKSKNLHMKKNEEEKDIPEDDFYNGALYDDSDQMVAYVYVSNFEKNTQKAKDCTVTGISISPNESGFSKDISFSLNDTVTFQTPSDEAIAALGKPGDAIQSGEDLLCLSWYGKNYKKNFYDSLTLTYEKETLTSVCLLYRGK